MTTERLYYHDCYLREFSARVVETAEDGKRVYLDRTAFYPTSGGQPFDTGAIGGAQVVDVVDEDNRIAHILNSPLAPGEHEASVDWPRRFDHMQQHSGQHMLSAVLEHLFKMKTLSFHMGAESSTIEVRAAEINAASLSATQIAQAEDRCAEIVAQAIPLTISFDDASADLGLRKASERTGTLRLVSIEGVDRSACGGTHVRNTAEIGPVFIRKLEKLRGNVRLEFVCGARALKSAKNDFATLQELSRLLSMPASETPATVAAQMERLKAFEKSSQKLTLELAQLQGKERWTATAPDADGLRRTIEHGPIDDLLRTRAQAFVAQGKAVFAAISTEPPAILLAVSSDSGLRAGERVKAVVSAAGGRGGGNAALAQGSLPAGCDLEKVAESLVKI